MLDTFKSEFLLTAVCVDMSQSNCSLLCRSSVSLPAFVRMSAMSCVVLTFCAERCAAATRPEATDIVYARVSLASQTTAGCE